MIEDILLGFVLSTLSVLFLFTSIFKDEVGTKIEQIYDIK